MKRAIRIAVPPLQYRRAKIMRAKTTEPERRLRRALRQRLPPDGTHFRRQVPIGPYIVDFCCLALGLVVEVDGNQHGTDEALAFDAKRTELIEAQGFRVLRFSNFDILRSIDSVLDTIFASVVRTPTPAPPHEGEGGASNIDTALPKGHSPPPCGEGQGVGVVDEGCDAQTECRPS